MVLQHYSQPSLTLSNVAFSLPKWAFDQPTLTLLEPELVTSCTVISETMLYKDWSQVSSCLPLHYHARHREFRDFIIWWRCLYTFQKRKQILQRFFPGVWAIPTFHRASQHDLGIHTDLLFPLCPFNALLAPSPRGTQGQETFMLEILSIQLVTLPVYTTPLCKSTKKSLESQVGFIYTGLMLSCMFLMFSEKSQGKVCLNFAAHERSREQRGQHFIPQNLLSQSLLQQKWSICWNM